MSQSGRTGLFVHPDAARRNKFQSACGETFGRLRLAGSAGAALEQLAQGGIDLLIVDLAGCTAGDTAQLTALCMLVRTRNGAPVLVLCPFGMTAWLPELMGHGPLHYRISPVIDVELCQAVAQLLRVPDNAHGPAQQLADKERESRELLTLQRSVQRAIGKLEDVAQLAAQVCTALCSFPGVRHTALLQMKEGGNLRLLDQEARNGLDLERLLGCRDGLLASPLRDVFPPLLAVSAGELVLLDAPEKAGDPQLAATLHAHDVHMVLALPLRGEPDGPIHGAISVMFERQSQFSREQFACFAAIAQCIGFALAMSELKQQNDALAGRLAQVLTTDPLTGAINRRAGEQLLDTEIRRARRYGLPLAVIACNIDNFRSVNDAYGYPIGDQALRAVSHTIAGRLRVSDRLARMRGEEFLVIATHTTARDALRLAEKLRATVAGTELPGCETVTISLGVAQVAQNEDAAAVMDRVDGALRQAKRRGRNCVELAQ